MDNRVQDLDQIQERDHDDRGRSLGSIVLAALMLVGLTFAIGVVVGRAREPDAAPEDPLAKLDAKAKAPIPTAAAKALPKVEAADLSFPSTLSDEEERPEVLAALEAAAAEEAALEAPGKPVAPEAVVAAVDAAPKPAEGNADDATAAPCDVETQDLVAAIPAAVAAGSGARNLPRAAKHDPLVAAAIQVDDERPPSPRGHDGELTLQVISYDRPEPARSFAEGLRQKGHAAFVVSADIPDRGRYYRVRIGPFETRAEADAYRQTFEDQEHMNTYVVREKPDA